MSDADRDWTRQAYAITLKRETGAGKPTLAFFRKIGPRTKHAPAGRVLTSPCLPGAQLYVHASWADEVNLTIDMLEKRGEKPSLVEVVAAV